MVVIRVGTLRQVPTGSRIENSDVWILGFPCTALSLVSPWTHAHASVCEGSVIFPFFQFQYVSGCRQSLNDGIMHAIDFVIGGRREVRILRHGRSFRFHLSVQQKVVEAIFHRLFTSPSERKRYSTDSVPWLLRSDWRGGQDQVAPQMSEETVKMVSLAPRERVQQRSVHALRRTQRFFSAQTGEVITESMSDGLVLRRAVGKFNVHFSLFKREHEDVYGKDQSKGGACRSGSSSPSGLECRAAPTLSPFFLTTFFSTRERRKGESLLAQKVGVWFSSPIPFGVQNNLNPRGFQVD